VLSTPKKGQPPSKTKSEPLAETVKEAYKGEDGEGDDGDLMAKWMDNNVT